MAQSLQLIVLLASYLFFSGMLFLIDLFQCSVIQKTILDSYAISIIFSSLTLFLCRGLVDKYPYHREQMQPNSLASYLLMEITAHHHRLHSQKRRGACLTSAVVMVRSYIRQDALLKRLNRKLHMRHGRLRVKNHRVSKLIQLV